MTPGLVIFDCDGVLVDSVGIDIRELTHALVGTGLRMTEAETHAAFNGASIAAIAVGVEARLGRPAPDGWLEVWFAGRRVAFERELKAVVGAAEAIAGVRALGCEACVASQGEVEKMEQTLRVSGLGSCFEPARIFSASMVPNGKPAPDLFLHAARECGFRPEACVVVEDSETGVTAARAAGMRVLGYVADPRAHGALSASFARLGVEVFHDMYEVPERVAQKSDA